MSMNSSMLKTAVKTILFHGTSTKNLRSILSQGLIPDPKERAWSKDEDANSRHLSKISYGGIYLTQSFMTAKSSATNAGDPRNGVIVAVRIETKTLTMDEDSIVYSLQRALANINEGYNMNEHMLMMTFIEYKLGNISDNLIKSANGLLDYLLRKVEEPRRTHVKENTFDDTVKAIEALLIRNMAYTLGEYKDWGNNGTYEIYKLKNYLEERGLSLDDIPSKEDGEAMVRGAIDTLTRKLSAIIEDPTYEGVTYTARQLEPIAFSGANRIMSVMTYSMPKDFLNVKTKIVFHYSYDNGISEMMLKEFNHNITSNVEVEGLND